MCVCVCVCVCGGGGGACVCVKGIYINTCFIYECFSPFHILYQTEWSTIPACHSLVCFYIYIYLFFKGNTERSNCEMFLLEYILF